MAQELTVQWVKDHRDWLTQKSPELFSKLPSSDKVFKKILDGEVSEEIAASYKEAVNEIKMLYAEWLLSQPTLYQTEEPSEEPLTGHISEAELMLTSFLNVPVNISDIRLVGIPTEYDHRLMVTVFAEKYKIPVIDGKIIPLQAYEQLTK